MQSMYERIGCAGDMFQRLLFVLNGSQVKRFHTVPTIKEITVGYHQHGVAMLYYLLCDGSPTVNGLMACLVHDTSEQVGGDMPSPGKVFLGINVQLNDLETMLLRDNQLEFILTKKEKFHLKMADYLQGMLECVNERALGNRHAELPYGRWVGLLRAMCKEYTSHDRIPANVQEIYDAVQKLWEEAIGN